MIHEYPGRGGVGCRRRQGSEGVPSISINSEMNKHMRPGVFIENENFDTGSP